jgi:tetratricopeptide (TPR) repeat protein
LIDRLHSLRRDTLEIQDIHSNLFSMFPLLARCTVGKRRAGTPELHGEIKVRLAMLAYLEYDFLASGKLYQSVVDQYGDRFGGYLHCIAIGGVGKSLMARKCYEDALPWFYRAIEISEAAGATLLVAKDWSELGVCYLGLNQIDKALQVNFEAEKILLAAGAMHAYQVNLADIGNVYLQKEE